MALDLSLGQQAVALNLVLEVLVPLEELLHDHLCDHEPLPHVLLAQLLKFPFEHIVVVN